MVIETGRNLSLRLKEHKRLQTDRTRLHNTTRFFVFKSKHNIQWKEQHMQTEWLKLPICGRKFEKNGKILTSNDSANSKFTSSY